MGFVFEFFDFRKILNTFSILFIFLLISFSTLPNNNLLSLDNPEIKEIENYLNKLNNITSNFIQTNSNGLKVEGKIFLSMKQKVVGINVRGFFQISAKIRIVS